MITILTPDLALVLWYLFWAAALGGLAALAFLGYERLNDIVLAYLSNVGAWIAVDLVLKAGLRSPWVWMPTDWILGFSRIVPICIAIFMFLTLDAYFASRNGHLDLLRRILRWWDWRSQRWEDKQRV